MARWGGGRILGNTFEPKKIPSHLIPVHARRFYDFYDQLGEKYEHLISTKLCPITTRLKDLDETNSFLIVSGRKNHLPTDRGVE